MKSNNNMFWNTDFVRTIIICTRNTAFMQSNNNLFQEKRNIDLNLIFTVATFKSEGKVLYPSTSVIFTIIRYNDHLGISKGNFKKNNS